MIINGDCLQEMKKMEDCSIDFIVTDPPYGISFMSKQWDREIPPIEYWQEMLRIVKPGGHLLAAGLPRMIHRLISVIEDAGWIIRDLLMHLFGSGFPKSHNHFGLEGYGTCLKPAWEAWSLSMKPLEGTFKQNVEKWGLGGINIEQSRIGNEYITIQANNCGRWPANLILDEESSQMLNRQSRVSKSSYNDCAGASRFFYCPKASSKERNAGLEGMELKECQTGCGGNMPLDDNGKERDRFKKKALNPHPTVKPLSLMRYIIKLLAPPGNPTLLDPFAGSGSTLIAAKQLGINSIGIELNEEYCEIARKRLDHWQKLKTEGQHIFDFDQK